MAAFIFVVAMVCAVWWFISVVSKNPGDRAFPNPVKSDARLAFLSRTFGISRFDCQRFRFDGWSFHHARKVPYQNYTTVEAGRSEQVKISDAELPHIASWKFQCRDGSPDLRYRNNIKTMLSQRDYIQFIGPKLFVLHVYSFPGSSDMGQLVRKFDALVYGANEQDYEVEFAAFEVSSKARELARNQIDRLLESIATCDAVIAAKNMLGSAVNVPDNLQTKVEEAIARRLRFANEAEQMNAKIQEYFQDENAVVLAARSKSESAQARRTISQFS